MSEWKAKRFWKEARVQEAPEGYGVALDGRPVNTPGKRRLIVPTEEFAEMIAAEWDAQEEKIDPLSMPFTRSANSALDKVAVQHSDVAEILAAYGDSDLLCYRADYPEVLVQRQAEQWDPMLDWAEEVFSVRLETRTGVMHQPQDPAALAHLSAHVQKMNHFELTGFHDLVSLSGSLILGFAAAQGVKTPKAIWDMSRLDEIWQAEEWGADEEAEEAASIKEQAFIHAKQVFDLSQV